MVCGAYINAIALLHIHHHPHSLPHSGEELLMVGLGIVFNLGARPISAQRWECHPSATFVSCWSTIEGTSFSWLYATICSSSRITPTLCCASIASSTKSGRDRSKVTNTSAQAYLMISSPLYQQKYRQNRMRSSTRYCIIPSIHRLTWNNDSHNKSAQAESLHPC